MSINITQELQTKNYKQSDIDAYMLHIESAKLKATNVSYLEKHHILPSKIFPEFSNLKKYPENLARISAYDHFIAHYMLAKMTKHQASIYALNCMNRVKKKLTKEELKHAAIMYEEFRVELSNTISKNNKGKPRTQNQRKEMSNRMKDTCVVRDATGATFRTSTSDPRYLSGELVSVRVGYIHTEKTKEKMRKSATNRGIPYTHVSGKIKYFTDAPTSSDWTIGVHYSKEQIDKMTSACVKKRFWTNIITGEQKRYEDCPGLDWIPGRRKFDNKINNTIRIFNIKTKEFYSKDKYLPLDDWEVYKNKHVFVLDIKGQLFMSCNLDAISKLTSIPKEMVDLWGKNNSSGFADKILLKRSFSSIKNKEEKEKAMNRLMGTKWGNINLVKISPLSTQFPDIKKYTWIP